MKASITISRVSKATNKGNELTFTSDNHKTLTGCYRGIVDMLRALSLHSEYYDWLKPCYAAVSRALEDIENGSIAVRESMFYHAENETYRFYIIVAALK